MFESFSFAASSIPTTYSSPMDYDVDISPTCSRSASPTSSTFSLHHSSSTSVDSLAREFTRHTIQPRTPIHRTSSSHTSSSSSSSSRRSSQAQTFFNSVRARRATAAKLQCDPVRAARIASVVGRLLASQSAALSPYEDSHPSSLGACDGLDDLSFAHYPDAAPLPAAPSSAYAARPASSAGGSSCGDSGEDSEGPWSAPLGLAAVFGREETGAAVRVARRRAVEKSVKMRLRPVGKVQWYENA